ncbi:jg19116, partial [Pararge aegeria aegeria]
MQIALSNYVNFFFGDKHLGNFRKVTVLGEYAGFDENEPTSRSGGKGLVIRRLKELHGYQRLVMIGDGAT